MSIESNQTAEKPSILEVVREGFFQTLGKITMSKEAAETAVSRTLSRLVELGKVTQDEARNFTSDLKTRIEKNRADLERKIDESVTSAMTSVRFPKREEVESLRERVVQLERLVDDLEGEQRASRH